MLLTENRERQPFCRDVAAFISEILGFSVSHIPIPWTCSMLECFIKDNTYLLKVMLATKNRLLLFIDVKKLPH